uniref:Neurotransmitter-gated ion-channel ligand-binding domain-containing protein n=2 Tax=Branchiostoma floridae TaxID=7739 RepID=C3ZK59_BRAFL|eukprot:XP_002590947.1 hypothetical protein BRAFLDRAFT_101102 [Branchiostoma floridae]
MPSGTFLLLCVMLSAGSYRRSAAESAPSSTVPADYNRLERPTDGERTVFSGSNEPSPTLESETLPSDTSEPPPTVVWLDLSVREVHELRWTDKRLMTSVPGKSTRILPKSLLWSPDLYLLNTNDDKDPEGRLEVCDHVRLHDNGTVVCRGQTILVTGCEVDLFTFPFDSQSCPLRFGSWLYGWDELRWENMSFTAEMQKEADWDLIGFPVKQEMMTHIGWRDPHSELTVCLMLRRKPFFKVVELILPCALLQALVVELILPCALLQALTFLGMLLPSAMPVRVQYNVTIFLVLILFLYSVEAELPGNTAHVPIIDVWFHNTMALVGFSILFIVVVLKVHHRPLSAPVPGLLRRLLLGKSAVAAGGEGAGDRRQDRRGVTETVAVTVTAPGEDGAGDGRHEKDNGILTTPNPRDKLHHSPVLIRRTAHARSLHDVSEDSLRPVPISRSHSKASLCTSAKDLAGTAQYFEKFDELSDKFDDILRRLDPGPEETETPEWTTVAMVIDRIFVIIWLIGALTSDVIILVYFQQDVEAAEERKISDILDVH